MVIIDVGSEVMDEIQRHIKELFEISYRVVEEAEPKDATAQKFAWYQLVVHISTHMLKLADNVLRETEVRYNGGGTESQG